jgi:hypothetical protein
MYNINMNSILSIICIVIIIIVSGLQIGAMVVQVNQGDKKADAVADGSTDADTVEARDKYWGLSALNGVSGGFALALIFYFIYDLSTIGRGIFNGPKAMFFRIFALIALSISITTTSASVGISGDIMAKLTPDEEPDTSTTSTGLLPSPNNIPDQPTETSEWSAINTSRAMLITNLAAFSLLFVYILVWVIIPFTRKN